MAVLYRIKNWAMHFETSDTRKVKEFSKYVPLPNRFDTAGYASLLDHAEGERHYGAWCAMVGIASRCTPRGTLLRKDGRPHTPASMSAMTRFKAKTFEALLARIVGGDIDWIEAVETDHPDTSERIRIHPDETERDRLEERRGEENRREEIRGEEGCSEIAQGVSEPDREVMVFQCDGKSSTWKLMNSRVRLLESLYPSLDVLTECRKAAQWLEDNPAKRKTSGGMARFLSSWMERSQNRGGGTRAGPSTGADLFGGLREFVQSGGES